MVERNEGVGSFNPNSDKPSEYMSDWSKSDEELQGDKDIEYIKSSVRRAIEHPEHAGSSRDRYIDRELIAKAINELETEGLSIEDIENALKLQRILDKGQGEIEE